MTEKDLELMAEMTNDRLTLLDEDDVEHEFEIIDSLEVNDNYYAVLLPIETDIEDDEEVEAVIMRVDIEDEEEIFSSIDSDEEWDLVVNAFNDKMWEEE